MSRVAGFFCFCQQIVCEGLKNQVKRIKWHLHIKKFWRTSENAVRIQIYFSLLRFLCHDILELTRADLAGDGVRVCGVEYFHGVFIGHVERVIKILAIYCEASLHSSIGV